MWIHGRQFTPAMIDRIASAVKADPTISRMELSRQVCQWSIIRHLILRRTVSAIVECQKSIRMMSRREELVNLAAYGKNFRLSSKIMSKRDKGIPSPAIVFIKMSFLKTSSPLTGEDERWG